jgi:ATP adenylyltransferase
VSRLSLHMAVERLWAAWRMKYIQEELKSAKECLFCRAIASNSDKEHLVLYRGRVSVIMLNASPYNPGHLMVSPNRHLPSMKDLTPGERSEMMELAALCEEILDRVYHPQGLNVGLNLGQCAGAGIPDHMHLHIVPRWVGDTNFMPVFGETRVLPEELDTTYERLHEALKSAKP